MSIPELLEVLLRDLSMSDLKLCVLVCRCWKSHLEPFLWSKIHLEYLWSIDLTLFDLYDRAGEKRHLATLARYGRHVRSIVNPRHRSSKKELDRVQRYCPFVERMWIVLDSPGFEFTYSYLESFFSHMSCLRQLTLEINLDDFSLTLLWSLANARHLTELRLTFSILYQYRQPRIFYTSDQYLTVVDCCSHIPVLALCGSFMEPKDGRLGSRVEDWMTRLYRAREMAPATPQTAIDRALRPRSSFLRCWSASSTTLWPFALRTVTEQIPYPTYTSPTLVRKLTLNTPGLREDDLLMLVSRCPLLEELVLEDHKRVGEESIWTISPASWIIIANSCQQLKYLRLQDCHLRSLPSITQLLSMFPNLNDIVVHPKSFWGPGYWSIFNFLDLNTDWSPCGQQQQRQYQEHQLKRISLVGNISDPLKVLLQLMIKFSGLESIKVGSLDVLGDAYPFGSTTYGV
ncbi:hypothetical protein MVEG_00370 [Podila verticillata NRRL 6337]|nr:hypothetical protein MVEG_00370 [Podila verticillata NRRL 6337]